ncbi:inorganic anion transporter, SulP family [Cooperia oncophora]
MSRPCQSFQELYAIGITSLLGSCFSVYPVSTALGRTMVNVKSGSKTLLSTLFSCTLLMAVILWLGAYLSALPRCVLASIITVALKSMFTVCGQVKQIYTISKIDFAIWLVSFLCTALIDVMEGLAISILFALFTVICRSQWPKWQYFFESSHKQEQNGEKPSDNPDICVFRFDGPLLFTNVERFFGGSGTRLNSTTDAWMKTWKQTEHQKAVNFTDEAKRPQNLSGEHGPPHFLIIDCKAIAYCDYMAACALNEEVE